MKTAIIKYPIMKKTQSTHKEVLIISDSIEMSVTDVGLKD